jgi:hypothetical protein
MRHKITGFQRHDNAIMDPILVGLPVFSRRGLISGTVEDILEKIALHSNRESVIGCTPADAYKPMLLHLTKGASYNDHHLMTEVSRGFDEVVGGANVRNLFSESYCTLGALMFADEIGEQGHKDMIA